MTGLPSRRTVSPGSARSPSFATCPRTVTRPALIQVSISRREPKPAAASSFWILSPAGLLEGGAGGDGGLLGRFIRRRLRGGGLELQRARDLLQRRQLLERAQAQIVEEGLRGRV